MAETGSGAARQRGLFWGFIAFMLVLMVLFVALGTWQVERLGEKERLIADVASRMNLPPAELPPAAEWGAFDAEAWNFRPVKLAGTWLRSGHRELVAQQRLEMGREHLRDHRIEVTGSRATNVAIAIDSGLTYHRWWKRPGTITVRFGETIPPGLPREEIEARVHTAINALNV